MCFILSQFQQQNATFLSVIFYLFLIKRNPAADLRNTDLNSEVFIRKLHRAHEALTLSQTDGTSMKTLSASFGTKWPYKRTMSAPASMAVKQEKQGNSRPDLSALLVNISFFLQQKRRTEYVHNIIYSMLSWLYIYSRLWVLIHIFIYLFCEGAVQYIFCYTLFLLWKIYSRCIYFIDQF